MPRTPEENLAEAVARIDEARGGENPRLEPDGLGPSELPEAVGPLTHLRELPAYHNRLTELPEFMDKSSRLEWLYIDDNKLMELPTFVGGLSNLAVLSVRDNKLTKLPDTVGDLLNVDISSPQQQPTDGTARVRR